MGARTLRFIYFVEGLALLTAPAVWAQSVAPTFTPIPTYTATAANTDTPTYTSTPTPTWTATTNPFATPTWTFTWDPFSTDTPTPGSPTDTPTLTPSFTPTPTGTLSPSMTFTATMTNTPVISRGALALWPTAYSNGWDHWNGLNWDIAFTYIIGTIAEREYSSSSVDWVNPLRLWMLTSDLKYGWLDEKGDQPAFASGLLMTELLDGGNPGGTGAGGNSFQLTGHSMGGVYMVMSKTIVPDTAVHFGYVYGFHDAFQRWGLGSFSPTMTYSQLVPLTTAKLSDIQNEAPPSIFYTGFNTRFLGTNWKFEVWKPFPMDENPVLLDTQIDGLFAFNLGYEHWTNGYAVLGYFNFRFTILPETPAY